VVISSGKEQQPDVIIDLHQDWKAALNPFKM
jgi:hypothetical protein